MYNSRWPNATSVLKSSEIKIDRFTMHNLLCIEKNYTFTTDLFSRVKFCFFFNRNLKFIRI